MSAIETFLASLPATDKPYYAGDYIELESEENPLFVEAVREAFEHEIYKHF
jgi:hypothetical protein